MTREEQQVVINTNEVPIYANMNINIPTGAIIMWSGEIKNVPAGWEICDGNKGTPDLRGRFIVGYDPADVDYNVVRKVGGEKAHKLNINEMPSHDHNLTGSSHNHKFTDQYFEQKSDMSDKDGSGGFIGYARSKNDAETQSNTHTHTIEVSGGNKEHENRPPFMVLAYIMKVL